MCGDDSIGGDVTDPWPLWMLSKGQRHKQSEARAFRELAGLVCLVASAWLKIAWEQSALQSRGIHRRISQGLHCSEQPPLLENGFNFSVQVVARCLSATWGKLLNGEPWQASLVCRKVAPGRLPAGFCRQSSLSPVSQGCRRRQHGGGRQTGTGVV